MLLMNELELWSDVEGYEGHYQVSNLGRVRSLDRGMWVTQDRYTKPRWMKRKGKVLKPGIGAKVKDRRGQYARVVLCKYGKSKTYDVHRLVGLHFVSNPLNKPALNHINADSLDNRAANLEWCTIAENNRHTISLGRKPCMNGSKGMTSKLNARQVRLIKLMLRIGIRPQNIANRFNISRPTIYAIKSGKVWKHISIF